MITKYQKFDTEIIHRTQIKKAEYNPRAIGKEEEKRLRKSIKDNGLIEAIVWNKRTGNLVGGHQRLTQLDKLEGNEDYELSVCVVDLDEKEEAKANVVLNSTGLQGAFDSFKLGELIDNFGFSADDIGFTNSELEMMFATSGKFDELFENEEVADEKEKIRQIKEVRKNADKQKKAENNNLTEYAVIVFGSLEERNAFFDEIHVPKNETYITCEQVYRLLANN